MVKISKVKQKEQIFCIGQYVKFMEHSLTGTSVKTALTEETESCVNVFVLWGQKQRKGDKQPNCIQSHMHNNTVFQTLEESFENLCLHSLPRWAAQAKGINSNTRW